MWLIPLSSELHSHVWHFGAGAVLAILLAKTCKNFFTRFKLSVSIFLDVNNEPTSDGNDIIIVYNTKQTLSVRSCSTQMDFMQMRYKCGMKGRIIIHIIQYDSLSMLTPLFSFINKFIQVLIFVIF